MNENNADFFKGHIKKCFVKLERLDERLLNQFREKYGLKTAAASRRKTKKDQMYCKTFSEKNKPTQGNSHKNRRHLKNFIYSHKFKRKKEKIKYLSSSDDESLSNFYVRRKFPANSHLEAQMLQDKAMKSTELEETTKREDESDYKKNLKKSQGEVDHCSNGDGEIEILKEFLSPRKTVYDKGALIVGEPALNHEPSEYGVLENGEFDSRDEGEDDRSTVIFEAEFHEDTDLDEIFEGKVTSKQYKNREITNRKKQRLAKFKRKSLAGKKLAKFRKPKTQGWSTEQGSAEKSGECVSEECLREVCGLVQRLHEYYRTILQLQREVPKSAEQGIYLERVLKAQQDNFHKELRKHQKTIIKCYEKMMALFGDASKIALEISKRTSLRAEDVINILSWCVHVEGDGHSDKSRSGTAQNGKRKIVSDNPAASMSINMSIKKIIRSQITSRLCVEGGSSGGPALSPCTSSRHVSHLEDMVNRAIREFHVPPTFTPSFTSGFMSKDSFTQRCRPQSRARESCLLKPAKDLQVLPQFDFSQTNSLPSNVAGRHPLPVKPVRSQPSLTSVQHCRVGERPHCTTGYLSDDLPQAPSSVNVHSVPPSAVEHIPGCSGPLLGNNKNPNILAPSDPENYFVIPNNPFPRVINTQRQMIQSRDSPCPLSTVLRDSFRWSSHDEQYCREMVKTTSSFKAPEDSAEQTLQILDPTVPQKLTMKNCRLQAGPTLGLRVEGTVKSSTCEKQESLNPVYSKAREYVCAQNECKNPGVRICKQCQSVIYCSETCQLKHWNLKHKVQCYQLKELRG